MNYREALTWLFGTQRFGIKLGLENSRRLFAALEVPRPNERIIHVAGTNGKGSVCAMIDAICRAAGYRTGLFTSPHLVTFRERIQVNGQIVEEAAVARGLTTIRNLVAAWEPHPTFFEITTALALDHFRNAGCDMVILETGMGGRLDATNATEPVVSVITPIDLDHQKWLGNTIEEIAAEKAGIIKPGVPAVAAAQKPEAETVLRKRARECGTSIDFISAPYRASPVALPGAHQEQNAALAIAALQAARIDLATETIVRGLATVSWPARFQKWTNDLVIDGAHNAAGAKTLAQTWRASFPHQQAIIVLGILRDKDAATIVAALAEIADAIYLPAFRGERVLRPEELRGIVGAAAPAVPCQVFPSIASALRAARQTAAHVLVTGSLHLAGEALAFLRGEPAAFEECSQ